MFTWIVRSRHEESAGAVDPVGLCGDEDGGACAGLPNATGGGYHHGIAELRSAETVDEDGSDDGLHVAVFGGFAGGWPDRQPDEQKEQRGGGGA